MKVTEIIEDTAKERNEQSINAERKQLIEIIESKPLADGKESNSEEHDAKLLTGVVEEGDVIIDCVKKVATEKSSRDELKVNTKQEKSKEDVNKSEKQRKTKPLKKISITEIKPMEKKVPITEIPLKTETESKEVLESDSVKEKDNSDNNKGDKDKASTSSQSEERRASGKLKYLGCNLNI